MVLTLWCYFMLRYIELRYPILRYSDFLVTLVWWRCHPTLLELFAWIISSENRFESKNLTWNEYQIFPHTPMSLCFIANKFSKKFVKYNTIVYTLQRTILTKRKTCFKLPLTFKRFKLITKGHTSMAPIYKTLHNFFLEFHNDYSLRLQHL